MLELQYYLDVYINGELSATIWQDGQCYLKIVGTKFGCPVDYAILQNYFYHLRDINAYIVLSNLYKTFIETYGWKND